MSTPNGFSFKRNKDSTVVVFHRGRRAAVLSKGAGADFIDEVSGLADDEAQHLMARITGNYKRGNERLARSHFRNSDTSRPDAAE